MNRKVRAVRSPVKREGAERFVLICLVSFAASVTLTRLFLQLTGYPQLGNQTFHVAHVLWGGLLLFAGSLLPLILANRWALSWSALASGVGIGLFIDEVGKFITQNNDYFYPPAAPIIYAFFLLTVLLYLQVRRPPARNPRAELYRVLDELSEALDHDLSPTERQVVRERLQWVMQECRETNLAELAASLLAYVNSQDLEVVEREPWFINRAWAALNEWAEQRVPRLVLKYALIVSLGTAGVVALVEVLSLIWIAVSPSATLELILAPLITAGEISSEQDALWLIVRLAMEGVSGLLLLASAVLLFLNREQRAIWFAVLGLLVALTAVNLLVFYLDQFQAVGGTLVQFVILNAALWYRRRFLGGSGPGRASDLVLAREGI